MGALLSVFVTTYIGGLAFMAVLSFASKGRG